ncbi:MAG: methyltransferase domain-containing protein [Eubacterium sp.]|nr:methyltransferase domain-containing protein [Eubacterium sp.]
MASKLASKYMYKVMSPGYDILDKTFLRDNGKKDGRNPRDVLAELIPDEKCRVLDMCCGTGSNGIGVAIRKSQVTVVELDRSKSMLLKARQKVNSLGLRNVKIICRDATDTGLKDELFDYVIIGLALHECNPDLWNGILSEAHRLLKKDGHLIILDWERQKGISNKIKFAPMYITETICTPKYFREYFNSDKEVFFSRFGFKAEKNIRCKYTFVMSLRKDDSYNAKRKINDDASYLAQTHMLDYDNYMIQELIRERGWRELPEFERIRSIYNFIRDEIRFGYNVDDSIPASKVLKDGYGQCNTKGTLFMALLRAVGIPCRVHGFTIRKELQEGAMTGFVYKQAPQNIFHSWVEVYLEGKWYELEAFIIDKDYLGKLQQKNSSCTGAFCKYGVGVEDFKNPVIDFNRNNTYIQSTGINQDFGIYDSPDALLKEHHQEMGFIKKYAFRYYGRHMMNRNVRRVRGGF